MDNTLKHGSPGASSPGATATAPVRPPLTLSTKCRIWGDGSGTAFEPTAPQFEADMRKAVLQRDDHRCGLCGFRDERNGVHSMNDNHCDLRPDNLIASDILCHGWSHLGELDAGQAAIAYLPGLSAQDVNHFQRTLLVALQSDDEAAKSDARMLLNWAASHRDYTKLAWGTYQPSDFAQALVRLPEATRGLRELTFAHLALIYNPASYKQAAAAWAAGPYAAYPVRQWPHVARNVMNAPT